MQLSCVCGYPLFLTAFWDESEYSLVARDGKQGESSAPIIACPQCGQSLTLEALAQDWAASLERPPRPDDGPDPDREYTG